MCTLNSKRKYTYWVSASRYSKPRPCQTHGRLWWTAHWNSNPNKTEFAKKIQRNSKVVNKVWRRALSASNTEVNGENRFLWTFSRDFPVNFSLELWNYLEFSHKPKLDCCRTLLRSFSNLSGFLVHLHFEYSLGSEVYTFFWSRV